MSYKNAVIYFWSGTGNSYRVSTWMGKIAKERGIDHRSSEQPFPCFQFDPLECGRYRRLPSSFLWQPIPVARSPELLLPRLDRSSEWPPQCYSPYPLESGFCMRSPDSSLLRPIRWARLPGSSIPKPARSIEWPPRCFPLISFASEFNKSIHQRINLLLSPHLSVNLKNARSPVSPKEQ